MVFLKICQCLVCDIVINRMARLLASDRTELTWSCCWSPHQCLIGPGILIVLFNLPLWRSLINSFKAWKSIRRPTWTLDVAGSIRNQTMADVMFSDGFCIEPRLSAVLQILIHLTLTSLLWTVNFASTLGGGGGVRGRLPKSLPGFSGRFCLQRHLNDSNAEQENLCRRRLNTPLLLLWTPSC